LLGPGDKSKAHLPARIDRESLHRTAPVPKVKVPACKRTASHAWLSTLNSVCKIKIHSSLRHFSPANLNVVVLTLASPTSAFCLPPVALDLPTFWQAESVPPHISWKVIPHYDSRPLLYHTYAHAPDSAPPYSQHLCFHVTNGKLLTRSMLEITTSADTPRRLGSRLLVVLFMLMRRSPPADTACTRKLNLAQGKWTPLPGSR